MFLRLLGVATGMLPDLTMGGVVAAHQEGWKKLICAFFLSFLEKR